MFSSEKAHKPNRQSGSRVGSTLYKFVAFALVASFFVVILSPRMIEGLTPIEIWLDQTFHILDHSDPNGAQDKVELFPMIIFLAAIPAMTGAIMLSRREKKTRN